MSDPRHLNRIAYFAAVVETGSFTAAAARLGITKAVVSQQVAKLEEEVGASLLVRTTRKVRPTEAGMAFHRRCVVILREAEDAFGELAETAAAPSGLLRLTAPFDYGVAVVVPAIAAFVAAHPACKADMSLSDQALDLVGGTFDLAIRVGWLADTSLQARQFGSFRQLLVGTPALAARMGEGGDKDAGPEDIAALPFVANTVLRNPLSWQFTAATGEARTVSPRASIALDATFAVREAVREGAGLSVLPDYCVADDLASGRLVRILPGWSLPPGGIHAVFPAARFRPTKVRAFVDLLTERERRRMAE
ncbi:LysR family transcriptional regulator [Azospirillum melinis]|uniref:LysR family transcriptional regulator n=1 Tax=Azospirillum melinis TaxID=328839 RepID=A0ABX2KDH2_9PROT|nr:LysR family transcriptional regulator [Azospirillum melinis]MBP2306803.1 DNA-binding transcriptional LysR family regulator [Azospirillum melinis]NUA98689.1 LysR family transcriptional regulator [Azospirillum melinis]